MAKLTRRESVAMHLQNISQMGRNELIAFDMKLQEVKSNMDSIVFKWVNKGVLKQMEYLDDIDSKTGGAMAIISELKHGEL
jgi:hypothetical protein